MPQMFGYLTKLAIYTVQGGIACHVTTTPFAGRVDSTTSAAQKDHIEIVRLHLAHPHNKHSIVSVWHVCAANIMIASALYSTRMST